MMLKYVLNAKKYNPDPKFKSIIDTLLAEAQVHSRDEKKWNQSIDICKQVCSIN